MEDKKREDFEHTAVPYFNIIYNSAYRMTGNKADAEDLVQDVFLSAYKSFHQFESGTNCRAWLFKILKNTFINKIKKAGREAKQVRELGGSAVREFNSSTPVDKGLDETIQNALNRLPEEFRMAIVLCDVEGFSYQEISEIMECPVGTVRSRISRGRQLLAEDLSAYSRQLLP